MGYADTVTVVTVHYAMRVTDGVFTREITVTDDRIGIEFLIRLQRQIGFYIQPYIGISAIFATEASCIVNMS